MILYEGMKQSTFKGMSFPRALNILNLTLPPGRRRGTMPRGGAMHPEKSRVWSWLMMTNIKIWRFPYINGPMGVPENGGFYNGTSYQDG